ncbi:sigma-54-dependent transcriptional regulator [Desulfomarina sp.]
MKGTLLIVDDREKLCMSFVRNFQQRGYKACYAVNSRAAVDLFSRKTIHAVLLDIMLGNEDGLVLLQDFKRINSKVPVIMITGHASISTAVESIKLGAFDYVQKPLDFEKLLNIVDNAVNLCMLKEENRQLRGQLGELAPRFVSRNELVLEMFNRVKKLAVTNLPVLITGENGTGKELIADYIHAASPRNITRMLKINCASFAESLLENELFGHEKGAFSGADSEFKGVFERADGSSLFLDEIGDMPVTIQAKILRTLQNNEIRRLGGNRTILVDVRFIAATNKNLMELIREGSFRQDLYYRLNTAIVNVPPLRDRKDDIPLLVKTFLDNYASENGMISREVSDSVMERLMRYDWPGNVRELKNVINYASAISSTDTIGVDDLPPDFMNFDEPEISLNIREEMERDLLVKMLKKTGNNKKKTAELLKMSRKTLYNKLSKYGISA